VTAGEWLVAEGWWVGNKEHRLQFKASTMKTVPPTKVAGMERYLGSGLVKGIGPVLAKKLVEKFGAEVLTVMLFLHSHGVSTSRAVRVFKTYGEQAIAKVRENPYTLAKDIYRIGFATADQITQKVGIPRESINRARAGIDHVLLEATSKRALRPSIRKAQACRDQIVGVPEAIVEDALSQMLRSGSLLLEEIVSEPLIFLPHLRRAEEGMAQGLSRLREWPPSIRQSISRRPAPGATSGQARRSPPASGRP
jgi:exodeoxyribonuclease V alpha subunit